MANPNIALLATMTGKTAVLVVTTTPTDAVTNSAASGKIFKINTLSIANIDGTSSADVTVSIYRSTVEYKLAHTVAVPADSSLLVITKDNTLYLEEGDAIRITASANSMFHAVCSYDEIS